MRVNQKRSKELGSATQMRSVAALLILVTIGCNAGSNSNLEIESGSKYREALVAVIERADEIVIKEYSNELDRSAMAANANTPFTPVIYDSRTLTRQQASGLLAAVRSLDATTQTAFSLCMFRPHHTVEFYERGKVFSRMDVCFECSQVKWDMSRLTPPAALYTELASFIKSIGLNPVRDWEELAKSAANRPDDSLQLPR